MKTGKSVYVKILIALLVAGVVPMTISSFLIATTYQEVANELINKFYQDDLQKVTSEKAYIEKVSNNSRILVVITLCISFLITIFFTIYITKAFTLPLVHMTRAVEILGRGDYSVRIKTERKDEFGRMALGFNDMAQALAQTRDELAQSNLQLEKRVAERTAELTLINNELRKTSEKIHESGRVKDEFLSNISHELRTPLNAILGYSDLLLDGVYGKMTTLQRQSLDKVKKNSKMLLRLINDILDLSRMEEGQMPVIVEEFDPVVLVNQTVEGVQPLFEKKGLDIVTEYGKDLQKISSDKGKIQQVLLNFMSNSLKFTEKGRVSIKIEQNIRDGTNSFIVKDTGCGIAKEDMDIVFDQFRQLDGSHARRHGGVGLGLAISKKIASVLDGEILLTSELNNGSSFTFKVPLIYGDFKAIKSKKRELGKGRPVVIAIDDDDDTLNLIKDSLEPEGYNVIGYQDIDKGIRKTKELLPFAVTLDIMMPYRDGWNVLRDLKSSPKTKNIPVIIVSIIDKRDKGYELGVKDYIVKPIDRKLLITALENISP